LEDDPELGTINLLATSHSSLIPTDRDTGLPIHETALIQIFEQPDRSFHLRSIPDCLAALKKMAGVKELTREQAIKRALELDDLLTEEDLKEW